MTYRVLENIAIKYIDRGYLYDSEKYRKIQIITQLYKIYIKILSCLKSSQHF